MSLKRVLCVASISSAVAMSLYGVGCSSSSPSESKDSGGGGNETGVMHHPDTGSGGNDSQGDELSMINEGGTGDGPSAACTPPSTLTVTPVLHDPGAASMCTAELVSTLITACFDPNTATVATCTSARGASTAAMACLTGCMLTDLDPTMAKSATSEWGGVLNLDMQGGLGFYNLGGCIAALDSSAAGQKCATDVEANVECLTIACGECSDSAKALTDAQLQDFSACQAAAEPSTGTGPCTPYSMAVNTDCTSEIKDTSPGPGIACFEALNVIESETTSTPVAQSFAAFKVLFGSICAPSLLTSDGGVDGG
jgi:hypothetical protein